MRDTGTVALYAVKYCIENQGKKPGLVIAWIKKNWQDLSEETRLCITDTLKIAILEFPPNRNLALWKDLYSWISWIGGNSKPDSVEGDESVHLEEAIADLQKQCDELKKQNQALTFQKESLLKANQLLSSKALKA